MRRGRRRRRRTAGGGQGRELGVDGGGIVDCRRRQLKGQLQGRELLRAILAPDIGRGAGRGRQRWARHGHFCSGSI